MSLSSLEQRSNFYLHLPSNSPLPVGGGKKNTLSRFNVMLPNKVHLTGQWKAGLAEIFIPSYGYNIKPPLTSSIINLYEGGLDSEGYS